MKRGRQETSTRVPSRNAFLDRRFVRLGVSWESAAWIILIALSVALRLYALGDRAMSHDEGQHVFFSYNFFSEGNYQHSPITHGPFLFHLNALLFALLGVNDTVARLGPALSGSALVGCLYLFRPLLGRVGAMSAALILSFSPSLLFYSRYIRNDVYIAFFSLGWTYFAWRYIESPKPRWLLSMALFMALCFSTKETSFIFGALIGAFFLIWAIAAYNRNSRQSEAALTLSLLMASMVLPFASPLVHFALGWSVTEYVSAEALRHATTSVALTLLVALSLPALVEVNQPSNCRRGFWTRLGEWTPSLLSFWAITVTLFTTLFTNLSAGLVSGFVGSLGYWLTQQEVARGSQPVYYYGVLALLYEPVPLLLSLAGAGAVGVRLARRVRLVPIRGTSPEMPSTTGTLPTEILFPSYLVWWTFGAWVAYSLAGEKMPWLLTQIVLPMTLLGGWWVSNFVEQAPSPGDRIRWGLLLVGPLALIGLFRVATSDPFQGRLLAETSDTLRFVSGLILIALAAAVAKYCLIRPLRGGVPLLFAGLLGSLLCLTALWSCRLNFRNYDLATEFLVYAHGTPDIKKTLRDLQTLRDLSPGGELSIGYDDEVTWPLGWYLRPAFKTTFYGPSPDVSAFREEVILLTSANDEKARPVLASHYWRIVRNLVWWPLPIDEALSRSAFRQRAGESMTNPWPYRKEFAVYLRRDLLQRFAGSTAGPVLLPRPVEEIRGPFAGIHLKQPRAVAASAAGSYLIADTGNHRVVRVDPSGDAIVVGGECAQVRGEGRGCVDPDGTGPLETGDGQFDEPWGVASDPSGRFYVADTWNGRIQQFDRQGTFLRKWGYFGAAEAPSGDPLALYGPRDLTVTGAGHLLVTDTGNKRLIAFDLEGTPLNQKGGIGSLPGQFDEPVGVAWDVRDGSLYVADNWNRRIQKLNADLGFALLWQIPEWSDRGALAKPYLALDGAGRVYATDPTNGQILVFTPEGRLLASMISQASDGALRNPTGIAFDAVGKCLLVADSGNDRVLAYSAEELEAILTNRRPDDSR